MRAAKIVKRTPANDVDNAMLADRGFGFGFAGYADYTDRKSAGQDLKMSAFCGLSLICVIDAILGSSALSAHLPVFNCIDGSNQHQDFEQQAIVNPNNQDQFKGGKQKQRATQAQSLRN